MVKLHNLIFFIIFSIESLAMSNFQSVHPPAEQKNNEIDFSLVIDRYRAQLETQPLTYSLQSKSSQFDVELLKYDMISQDWSPEGLVSPDTWRHDVDIYIPATPKSPRALVVINNGINYEKIDISQKKHQPDVDEEALVRIARATNTIVISVNNIPNQYLSYEKDGLQLKEDDSVARSWMLFMKKSAQREIIPLHVPMSTAVSQALRLAKQELKSKNINKFVVTGASKRGWVAWLTAINDASVDAIIPFVMDLLNTRESLRHMYHAYGENWPIAFYPYYQQGIDKTLMSDDFFKLMKIEDPLQYLNSKYHSRLNMPKYIINASGDDFYVPDNSDFYYDKLPGKKSLRVMPNAGHYDIKQIMEQSLITFMNRFQNKIELPKLKETIIDKNKKSRTLNVDFSEPPIKVIRWTATNLQARDFRYACGIRYVPSVVDIEGDAVGISLNSPISGWQASYIEATFTDGYVATTQVHIVPENVYPTKAPPAKNERCQTLPGRGSIKQPANF